VSLIGNIVDKWETKSVKMADLVSIYFGESNREHGNDVAYAYAHFLECWVHSSNKMQEYQSCCLDTTFYLGVRLSGHIVFVDPVISLKMKSGEFEDNKFVLPYEEYNNV